MSFIPVRAKPKSNTKYVHGSPYYAELYGMPLATIVKYHKKDYPLDDPAELLQKILSQRSPNKPNLRRLSEIVEAGKRSAPPVPPPIPQAMLAELNRGNPPPKDTPQPRSDPESVDPLEGFSRELSRLADETDQAYLDYKDQPDPILKSAHWKVWKEMLESWGKLAKIAPNAEAEAKLLVRATEVDATWSRTFKEMRTILETLPRRLSSKPAFRALNPVDVEQAVIAELDKVMALLAGEEAE